MCLYFQTCVSPRVKRALPCALGSNPHLELIGRIPSAYRPSLLFPPCNSCNEKRKKISEVNSFRRKHIWWTKDPFHRSKEDSVHSSKAYPF